MSLLDNLPHTCTARRRKRESDSMGGSIDTFPTVVFADRACWRQPASDQEVAWWQQRSVDADCRCFFAEDPQLQENDVLIFADSPGYYWDVKSYSVPDESVGLGALWRVLIQRVKGSVV